MISTSTIATRRPRLELFSAPESSEHGINEVAEDPAIAQLRAQWLEEGRLAGLEEGRAAEAAARASIIDEAVMRAREEERRIAVDTQAALLRSGVVALSEEQALAAERAEAAARRAIAATIEAIAPMLSREGLAQETARVAAESLRRAASGGRGRLYAHPDAVAELTAALGPLAGAKDGAEDGETQWRVIADPDLRVGAVRAAWRDGFAEIDLAGAARAALEAALRTFGPSDPEPSDLSNEAKPASNAPEISAAQSAPVAPETPQDGAAAEQGDET